MESNSQCPSPAVQRDACEMDAGDKYVKKLEKMYYKM